MKEEASKKEDRRNVDKRETPHAPSRFATECLKRCAELVEVGLARNRHCSR